MNPLITLSDNIIGAIVPECASDIQYHNPVPDYSQCCITYFIQKRKKGLHPDKWGTSKVFLPPGKWEIVGEVYKDKIGFDLDKIFKLYFLDKDWDSVKENDFRSFLASNDIYWVNPDPKPTPNLYDFNDPSEEVRFQKAANEWQRKQSIADEMKGNKVVICAKID